MTYDLQYSSSETGPWTSIGLETSPAELTGQGTTPKWYRIVAIDTLQTFQLGESADYIKSASNPIRVMFEAAPVLSASAVQGTNYITLSWTGCSDEYRLYKKSPEFPGYHMLVQTSGTSYVDFDISTDVEYCYYVVGLTDGELTAPSNIVIVLLNSEGVFTMLKSRSSNYNAIQIGIESTPGTAVPANKLLNGLDLTLDPNFNVKASKRTGTKASTGTQLGKEHTEMSLSGEMCFNTLYYLLSLMFGASNDTVDSTVQIHNWGVDPIAPIDPETATIEQGSSVGAEKVAFCVMRDLKLSWSNDAAEFEAGGFGAKYTPNITKTASPTEVPNVFIDSKAIGTYVSATGTGGSFTLLEDVIDASIDFSGLWDPSFHQRDDKESFDRVKELMPDFMFEITLEDGTERDDMYTRMMNKTLFYIGMKVLGPEIETGKDHELTIYMPAYVTNEVPGDKGGVHGSTFTLVAGKDPAFGLVDITLKNELASL